MLLWFLNQALATCWHDASARCPITFHGPEGDSGGGPWPSSVPLRVSGRCVIGGCAAAGEQSAVFYGSPPPVIHVVKDGARFAVSASFRSAGSQMELDQLLIPGQYVYGDVTFDVVGEIPPEAYVDWPEGLSFPPDGVHAPRAARSGAVERDIPSLPYLRDQALSSGLSVVAESPEMLMLMSDTALIAVVSLSYAIESVEVRVSWEEARWMGACSGEAPPREDHTFACLHDGEREGPSIHAGRYEGGRREGLWRLVDARGSTTELSYRDGLREGSSTTHYSSGILAERVTYREDLLEGPAERWWRDGSLRETGVYLDGAKHGEWTSWYPQRALGEPPCEVRVEPDVSSEIAPTIGGHILESAHYRSGLLHGSYERWLPIAEPEGWDTLRGHYVRGQPDGRFVRIYPPYRERSSWRDGHIKEASSSAAARPRARRAPGGRRLPAGPWRRSPR